MAASGSYDLHNSHRSVDAEVRRLAAQARSGWTKEARVLAWFGLQDGMSVLEVGSGPGFTTAQLLALLPTSHITCVDVDRALLDQASDHLQDKGGERVQFIEGSVMALELEDNQFDFVYARFLFQHLADPLGAAREIWRVLKPGGKLVIFDIDDGLFGLFAPPIPEFTPVLEAFGTAQATRGGNRHIGRNLPQILTAANFTNIDVDAVASDSSPRGVADYLQHIHPDRMQSLVKAGLLTEEQLVGYSAALDTYLATPDAYTLWLSLLVCGEKPLVA
ncbi:MAG: methyltransferase domain-containing protein [Caldilineaceae bacterium]